MWEETSTARLHEAHGERDALISRWRLLLASARAKQAANDPHRNPMTGFPRRTSEEVRRLNRLQAAYFSKNVRIFEPPLPEGVPARLERIVRSGRIESSDSVLDIGTGTGILIPVIQGYSPARIYGNDLSEAMLDFVRAHYPNVITVRGDAADLTLKDRTVGVAFINACYSNIIDKHRTFENLRRMLHPGGRLVISHPLGRSFVGILKENVPFPLDDFPASESEAADLFSPYGFRVSLFLDEEALYLLRLTVHP